MMTRESFSVMREDEKTEFTVTITKYGKNEEPDSVMTEIFVDARNINGLLNSQREAQKIREFLEGKGMSGEEATKRIFNEIIARAHGLGFDLGMITSTKNKEKRNGEKKNS